jgi:hypothetical protein
MEQFSTGQTVGSLASSQAKDVQMMRPDAGEEMRPGSGRGAGLRENGPDSLLKQEVANKMVRAGDTASSEPGSTRRTALRQLQGPPPSAHLLLPRD